MELNKGDRFQFNNLHRQFFVDALFMHIGRWIQNAKTLYEEICQPSDVKSQPMRVKL